MGEQNKTRSRQIRKHYERAMRFDTEMVPRARRFIDAGIACGKLLLDEKREQGHGNWRAWLKENFPGSQQRAALLMRMARHPEKVNAARSFRECERLLCMKQSEENPFADIRLVVAAKQFLNALYRAPSELPEDALDYLRDRFARVDEEKARCLRRLERSA